jgi:Arm DNA-binding domain
VPAQTTNYVGTLRGAQGRNRTTDTVIFSHVTANNSEQAHTSLNLGYLLLACTSCPSVCVVVRGQPDDFAPPVCPQIKIAASGARDETGWGRKQRKALTDVFVRTLPTPSAGRTEVADGRVTGLEFRVTVNGVRSWSFRFRDPRSGKTTRATIGGYPDVSLALARERAEALRRQVVTGENPVETKRRERELSSSKAFRALADRYLNEHARRHKRSADADERNLRKHILPRWANRRYDEIGRGDVIELVESLVTDGKPTLANRIQALVSSIYSFALDADLVKGNPCSRLRRRGVETIGRRVLVDDEIQLFWPAILHKPVSRPVGLALRLILLTACGPARPLTSLVPRL